MGDRGGKRGIVTVGLMLAMLMAAMESTVVSTAMPTVIGDLHGAALYPWVFSAYLLTSTTTVPIYGKFADVYGRRRVFLIASTLFLAGSMLSGAATSMPLLIAFRALQGLGAGGVLPMALTIVGDLYTLQERPRVQALFTGIWGISSLAGPMLGAVLTEQWSWRCVFYVNLPFCLLSMFLVGRFLREMAVHPSRSRVDYAGLALLTSAVVALLVLFLQLGSGGSPLTPPRLALGTLAGTLIVLFLRQESRAPDPMLPLDLFRRPVLAAATIGNVLIGCMMFATDTYMPLFMQGVRGGTAHSAGLVLTPLVLCWSIAAYVGGRALLRFGFRRTAFCGVSCILVASLGMAFLSATTALAAVMLTMALLGCGLGICSMTFLVSAQNAVEWNQRGVVTAASQFFRTISGAVGVGALGAVVSARMAAAHASGKVSANVLLNAHARAALSSGDLLAARRALEEGLHWVFVLLAGVAVASWLGVNRIARTARVEAPSEPVSAREAELAAALD